jgi:AGCS family alanine or glycine:cation symporter
MWLMAVIGAASAFVESTLAQIYKVRNPDGTFRGGPAYYIQQALGHRWLGVVFAVALILCFAFGFNGLQAFNMTSAIDYYITEPTHVPVVNAIMGLLLVVATAAVIFGGTHRISVITSVIVPIMAVAYILVAVATCVINWADVPAAFALVFQNAFDFTSVTGGFAGTCVMWGIKRGLFSNEAGMGSAPNAAATADVSHPCKQGLVQSLSVYIDTLVICTASAFMMLIYFVQDPAGAATYNGITLVQMAMNNSIGPVGIHFVTAAIILFAYSSLIGNYFYAESNILFIKDDRRVLLVFRLLCLAAIMYGALNSFDLAWNLADIFMGFMAIINLIAILLLGKWAFMALDDYTRQRRAHKNPVFCADKIEGLPPTQWWHDSCHKKTGEGDATVRAGSAAEGA